LFTLEFQSSKRNASVGRAKLAFLAGAQLLTSRDRLPKWFATAAALWLCRCLCKFACGSARIKTPDLRSGQIKTTSNVKCV
jgi:hypothetical protein